MPNYLLFKNIKIGPFTEMIQHRVTLPPGQRRLSSGFLGQERRAGSGLGLTLVARCTPAPLRVTVFVRDPQCICVSDKSSWNNKNSYLANSSSSLLGLRRWLCARTHIPGPRESLGTGTAPATGGSTVPGSPHV